MHNKMQHFTKFTFCLVGSEPSKIFKKYKMVLDFLADVFELISKVASHHIDQKEIIKTSGVTKLVFELLLVKVIPQKCTEVPDEFF